MERPDVCGSLRRRQQREISEKSSAKVSRRKSRHNSVVYYFEELDGIVVRLVVASVPQRFLVRHAWR
jgi:hypothetical protein